MHTNTSCTSSRGFAWRIHCGVEDTELNTNKQHALSGVNLLALLGLGHCYRRSCMSCSCTFRHAKLRTQEVKINRVAHHPHERLPSSPNLFEREIIIRHIVVIEVHTSKSAVSSDPHIKDPWLVRQSVPSSFFQRRDRAFLLLFFKERCSAGYGNSFSHKFLH